MYAHVAIFFVYLYCLDNFLGDWMQSFFLWVSDLVDSMGMMQLSYTIDSMGYEVLNGKGFFITAGVLTVLTACIVGTKNLQELEQGSN